MDKAHHTNYYYATLSKTTDVTKMNGARRVIIFCLLTAALPTILIVVALYLRHIKFADVKYAVSESDVVEIRAGQSSIFCEKHSLKMNSSFNAFQLKATPELSNSRKHIRLRKSMILPDDTLEYWGFYLLNGATVKLKVCSRHRGSRVLVIKGDRDLQTCGLLDHNLNKFGPSLAEGHGKVEVTFDTLAELVDTINHPKSQDKNYSADSVDLNNADEQQSNEILATNKTDHDKEYYNNEKATYDLPSQMLRKKRSNVKYPNAYDYITKHSKLKRDIGHVPNHLLDGGAKHGGNALNYTETLQEASASSFENDLLQCFDGKILLNQGFQPSNFCENTDFLANHHQRSMITTHEILVNGYYYYIFYSDNDLVKNDIHAVFDIYKPTFQYANLDTWKECINQTLCYFNIPFLSDEVVIVEVPTRDGIEHEEDDITFLVSTCHPRMFVYAIFPIAVIFIVLICAFL